MAKKKKKPLVVKRTDIILGIDVSRKCTALVSLDTSRKQTRSRGTFKSKDLPDFSKKIEETFRHLAVEMLCRDPQPTLTIVVGMPVEFYNTIRAHFEMIGVIHGLSSLLLYRPRVVQVYDSEVRSVLLGKRKKGTGAATKEDIKEMINKKGLYYTTPDEYDALSFALYVDKIST